MSICVSLVYKLIEIITVKKLKTTKVEVQIEDSSINHPNYLQRTIGFYFTIKSKDVGALIFDSEL